MNAETLVIGLMKLQATSKSQLVQERCKQALADVKRARTLIEKAQRRYDWAKQFNKEVEAL